MGSDAPKRRGRQNGRDRWSQTEIEGAYNMRVDEPGEGLSLCKKAIHQERRNLESD